MTLVPAAMALAGRAAWWLPKWLATRLPDVDIEGEGLRAHLEQEDWAAARPAAINADGAVFGLPERPIGPIDGRGAQPAACSSCAASPSTAASSPPRSRVAWRPVVRSPRRARRRRCRRARAP